MNHGSRRLGNLARWVLAGNVFALAAAFAPTAAGTDVGQAVRGFVAWCGIG